MDDGELPRRWQAWLVPRMQTKLLERLAVEPRAWTVPELVRSELATRSERAAQKWRRPSSPPARCASADSRPPDPYAS